MFTKESLGSVAILDLFHVIPMGVQLHTSRSFNHVFNFLDFRKYKIFNFLAIDKVFNVILNFSSILLFLLGIFFNSLLKVFNNILILKTIMSWGGGECKVCF
ncbi:MAG: hypothetical protein FWH54_05685 [Methanobrevibacter sp.]|nr:hypothetical protein [Methanobrevibacter sp.]